MNYFGSCLCGNITYEVVGEFEKFFFCHCRYCRKDTGSAHASNLFSSSAKLKWLKGEDEVKTYNYNNSGHIYQNEKANWDHGLEDIPYYKELPIE